MARKIIIDTIADMVADLLFYDRKEDEELPIGAIEEAIENGVISINKIVEVFREKLEEGIKDKK